MRMLFSILFPIAAALLTLPLSARFSRRGWREKYVFCVLAANLLLVLAACRQQGVFPVLPLTDSLTVSFAADGMSVLFTCLSAVMWLLAGVFSFEYMKHEGNNEAFYRFYLITAGVLNGIGFSSNYISLYLFYELMTLVTIPLVLHSRTREANAAALKYLFYSVLGASLALIGFFFLYHYGNVAFVPGGTLDAAKIAGREPALLTAAFLTIVGFGAKAGMFPLHGWLPTAHPVAPAPASAVLSGVITKAGVLAVVRVVYYQFGADFLRGTWVQTGWMILALLTVFIGSMLAFREPLLKRRLAYSSVSQVSYVLFGLSTLHPVGVLGALLHAVFHSTVKDGLFMAAGALIYQTHETAVDRFRGIGRRMPLVMAAFTAFGLSLVGIPPFCGFVSKWDLAMGSLQSGCGVLSRIGPTVLLLSAFLTAGYLLPVSISAFYPGQGFEGPGEELRDPPPAMTAPILLLAAASLLMGLFPTPLIRFFTDLIQTVL